MRQEEKSEPPSCLRPPIFMIGRDSRGHWVARENGGARGGLFVDCAGALKFARDGNGNRPPAVVMVSGVLELDIAPEAPRATEMTFSAYAHRDYRPAREDRRGAAWR